MTLKIYLNTLVATVGTSIAYTLGGYDKLLKALIIFVVIDYLTGLAKAYKSKTVNSYIGFKGISKKICLFFIVVIANQFDQMVATEEPILRAAAILFYVSNEGISIVENMNALGVPIPDEIKRRLLK